MADPIQFPDAQRPVGGVIPSVSPASAAPQTDKQEAVQGEDFKSILLDSLNEVNRLQHEADQGVQRLLTGETDNVSEVFNAINKADIAFDLLMQIRNKLTEAYQEIQQMRL